MAGITEEGFEPKPLEEIKTDLESGFRAVFGAAITVIAQSVFGQLIGIISDRLADVWQLGLALYNGSTREGAVGVQLDNIGALTGTTRLQATYTKVTLTCLGTNGTVIPAGALVSIPGVGTQFTNDDDSDPMSGGEVDVLFRAVETGPKTALAGTVTQIDTPVGGWDSVTNALDHDEIGRDVEADSAYRLRQVAELRAQGASTVAAIRAKIQELDSVTGVFVFENATDDTDVDGLPPHSFEVVTSGGDDTEIAEAIALYKPVGIATFGAETETVDDANGFPIDINFSHAEELEAYVTVNLTADAATYPEDGDDLVKAAIVALNPTFGIGVELRSSALIPAYVPDALSPTTTGVPGVLESALPLIGTAPSPVSSTTIVADNREQIVLDTSRIVVNSTLV